MPKSDPARRRGTIATFAVVLVIGATVLWLVHTVVSQSELQRCIDSGRRTCQSDP